MESDITLSIYDGHRRKAETKRKKALSGWKG